MFTGLIEEIGVVRGVRRGPASATLRLEARAVCEGLRVGDSVAVNGVCLTATAVDARGFSADAMHETLERSTLGSVGCGARVNLERAMAADGRFGGHIVSGHIDGTGRIEGIRRDGIALVFDIAAPPSIMRYIVEKGSIAVDGISLTVTRVGAQGFSVSMIPHTAAATTLGSARAGDRVNLECDIVGKYVERLMKAGQTAASSVGAASGFAAKTPTGTPAGAPAENGPTGRKAREGPGGIDLLTLAQAGF